MAYDNPHWPTEPEKLYSLLTKRCKSLTEARNTPVPSLANTAALIWDALGTINWAGFYLLQGEKLILGPFQGKPACILIPLGRGVCGTAAQKNQLQLVPDVHQFPGHIACDGDSRSEIVVPLLDAAGSLRGVLDIDSPVTDRFTEADAAGLSALCNMLAESIDWSHGLL